MRHSVASLKQRNERIFERLEDRRLLAGNVWADISNGFLIICGDQRDNCICVKQIDGKIHVSGYNNTTINWNSSACFTKDDICKGIMVDMKEGKDCVKIDEVCVPGWKLNVELGSGNDALWLERVEACGEICISGDSGKDCITIKDCRFDGKVGINTCDGNDKVDMQNVHICGALCVNTDSGCDSVNLCDVQVKQRRSMNPQSEEAVDEASILSLGKVDRDFFKKIKDCCCRLCCGLEIKTGTENDVVTLNKVCVDCFTSIDTDGGKDCVKINDSQFGQKSQIYAIETSGAETPSPDGKTGYRDRSGLCIQTGCDNDYVKLSRTQVFGALVIDSTGNVCCFGSDGMVQRNEAAIASNFKKPKADGHDRVELCYVCVQSTCDFQPQPWAATSQDTWTPSDCCQCGTLSIFTGNGSDSVKLDYVDTDCKALISTSDFCKLDGADCVTITNSCFNKGGEKDEQFASATEGGQYRCVGLVVWTGDGNDCVTICKVRVEGGVKVCTDGGKDKVWIDNLCADSIFCDTGSSSCDWLGIRNSKACWVCLDGGSGKYDTLALANNCFDNFHKRDFELFI